MTTTLKSRKTHVTPERSAVDVFLSDMGTGPLLTRQQAHDLAKRFGVHYSTRGRGIVPRVDLADHIARRLGL